MGAWRSRAAVGLLFVLGSAGVNSSEGLAQAPGSPAEPPDAGVTAPAPSEAEEPAPADASSADSAVAAEPEPTPAPSAPTPAQAALALPPADVESGTRVDLSNPDEVTVIGTRISQTAGSAHAISDEKLQRFEYDDPTAVFQSVPGVYSRGEDGVGMRNNIGLRGVNPDRSKKVTLLEDGILFAPAPYSAPAAYYFPLITRMTGVKVIKGPAAVSYGPYTIAGAIDLLTRQVPSQDHAMLDLAAGQYGYGKFHGYAGATTDANLGFLLEGVHLRNSGFKHMPIGGETGSVRNEWMGKLSYVLDPNADMVNQFDLKVTYSDEDADETYLGLTDEDFRRDPLLRYSASQLDHMKAHRKSIVLGHIIDFTPDLSLTTRAYHHNYYRVWRRAKEFRGAPLYDVLAYPNDPMYAPYAAILRGMAFSQTPDEILMIGPNERDFQNSGVETRFRAEGDLGALTHKLEIGARLHHDSVDRRHSQDGYVVGPNVLVPEGTPTETNTFEKVSTTAVSLHAADAFTWGPLVVTPGVRLELIGFHVNNRLIQQEADWNTWAVLPGIGAFATLFPGFGVLGGVYSGFSPPVPPNYPATPDQPLSSAKLNEPERSVNVEAGARYMLGAARAEVIGFLNEYSNLTDICTQSSGCTEMNLDQQFSAGEARIYGIEAFLEHTLRLGPVGVPLTLAYTWTEGQFLNSFESQDPIFGSVTKGDSMPYLPEHQLRGSVGAETRRVSGEVAVSYVSPMREAAGSEPVENAPVKTDMQLIVDLGAKVQIFDNCSVYANLRNLFNHIGITGHRPFGARPNAPRWFQIGTKLEF